MPAHYGELTLDRLEQQIGGYAHELGLETRFFQTNFEGAFVEHLHRLDGIADGIDPQPRRLDALLVGDPRRARDRRRCRRSRCTSATSGAARSSAASR